LYLSFPSIIQVLAFPRENQILEDFLKEVQHVITFKLYTINANNGNSHNQSSTNDDLMDIDNLNTLNTIVKNTSNSIWPKYCHICKTTGHTTDSCYYNKLTERNRKNNKNKKNNKNNKNKKGNPKKNQNKREKN